MDAQSPRLRNGRWKWTAVGILVSLLFLWLSTSRVRWGELGGVVAKVHWWPWLPLAVAAYLLGHVVRGLRCRMIVSDLAPITLLSATNVVVLGYGANNILPARLGELARAGMLAQRTGLSYVQCLTVTFLERILDAIVILVLFVVAASRRELPGWVRDVSDVATVIVSMAALVVLAAVLLPSLLPRAATHLTARLHERLGGRLVSTAYDIVQALAPLRRPGRAAGVLALSALVWVCEAGLFLAILPAFDLLASPALATLAMSMTNLGILAPSSPGFVGPFHFFCAKAIETSGVGPAVALSYAITVHAAFFVPVTTWAIGVIVAHGVQLSKTISLTRSARLVTRLSELEPAGQVIAHYRVPPPAPRATRFLTAVIEPMLPWSLVTLNEAERAQLLGAVTGFVAAQIEALPKHLRWKAHLGLLAFTILFQIATAGRLYRLPLADRQRLVERWAFGPASLPRQLFRLLRGPALLAFCDHPLVAGKLEGQAAPHRLSVVKGPA